MLAPGRRRQLARVRRLRRIEVGAPILAVVGRGVDVERQALAEAELEIAQRPLDAMRLQLGEHGELQDERRHLPVVAVRVIEFGDVAGGP